MGAVSFPENANSRTTLAQLTAWVICAGVFLPGCDRQTRDGAALRADSPEIVRDYVGSSKCSACHAAEFDAWRGSHHALAIQEATARTVLGEFAAGEQAAQIAGHSFRREGGRFFADVTTSSGESERYEISHTFGVEPLQQYLAELPGGRLQALTVAWDTRPPAEGGSRWYSLYDPGTAEPGSTLHSTGIDQNWNFMCADCHSTALSKRYDPQANAFATTWQELSVGCEACHGPGSEHVSRYEDRADSPSGGEENGLVAIDIRQEQVEVCARCHSRRSQIAEGYTPGDSFLDFYLPALIERGLYHEDGQIDSEVYVYGSYLQSKMFRAGVLCSDCHNAHSGKLERADNSVCTHCHKDSPPTRFPTLVAKTYDAVAHTMHKPGTEGASCIDCHMTGKDYMGHDFRRDHSFRVPRPDVPMTGVPDACTGCHAGQTRSWAGAIIAARFGSERTPEFASAFAGGQAGRRSAEAKLAEIAGSGTYAQIVRATALSLLGQYDSVGSEDALVRGLGASEPLLRIGALRGARRLTANLLWQHVGPLLDDSLLAVRIEATRTLVTAYESAPPSRRARLDAAVTEWFRTLALNADRPESHLNRGMALVQMGDSVAAETAFRLALELDPANVAARLLIAELYRDTDRESEAGELFDTALQLEPDQPEIYRAYAFWQVRRGSGDAAIKLLRHAADLTPDQPDYAYLYGLALNSSGHGVAAERFLRELSLRFPEHEDTLYLLSTLNRDAGNVEAALGYAKRLQSLAPGVARYRQLAAALGNASAN